MKNNYNVEYEEFLIKEFKYRGKQNDIPTVITDITNVMRVCNDAVEYCSCLLPINLDIANFDELDKEIVSAKKVFCNRINTGLYEMFDDVTGELDFYSDEYVEERKGVHGFYNSCSIVCYGSLSRESTIVFKSRFHTYKIRLSIELNLDCMKFDVKVKFDEIDNMRYSILVYLSMVRWLQMFYECNKIHFNESLESIYLWYTYSDVIDLGVLKDVYNRNIIMNSIDGTTCNVSTLDNLNNIYEVYKSNDGVLLTAIKFYNICTLLKHIF